MFRLSHNLKTVFIQQIEHNNLNIQSVRWRRKPRWLPVAKSKQFRVPPRTITPDNERIELMRLYNNYRTQIKAIRSYLHNEHNVKSVIIDTKAHEEQFAKEFMECNRLNNEWNEQVRVMREARHAQELDELKEISFNRIVERQKLNEERFEKAEEIVRKEKEASKSYITADNIDAAIERALSNPVDYNYSIDLDGNFYRKTKPEQIST